MTHTDSSSAILNEIWKLHQHPDLHIDDEFSGVELSLEQGQQLQLALLQRYLDNGHTLGGWKIGMTSGASRNAMGEGVRPFGFVLEDRILPSGAQLPRSSLYRGGVENELCLTLAHTLGAEATPELAKAAVAHVAPAFEINQKRLPPDAHAGLRIADNLSNWGIVVGLGVTVPATLEQMTVTLGGEQEDLEQVPSAGHIDDHFASLAVLAQQLAQFGQPLRAGHRVITGAYGKTPFAPGIYTGEFDQGVGRVEVQLLDT